MCILQFSFSDLCKECLEISFCLSFIIQETISSYLTSGVERIKKTGLDWLMKAADDK
jgi:hypothetical protein